MQEDKDWLLKLPRVRAVNSEEEYKKIVEAAAADNHGTFFPTLAITKGEEVVGYFSIGALPLIMMWLSTVRLNARESMNLLNTMEAVAAKDSRFIAVPCPKDSPFYPLMEKMGYTNKGNYDLFVKEV